MLTTLRQRNPLPPGTAAIGMSLGIAGLTSYGFLIVAARALGREEYAPLSALWTLVILVGPGVFLPLEQEVSRALSARRANGLGGRPLVVRAAALGGGLLAVVMLISGALSRFLGDRLFDGSMLLACGFLLSLAAYFAGHLTKGLLSGTGRFGAYARYTAGESTARFLLCLLLAAAGMTSAGPYGVAVGAAPLLAVGAALLGEHRLLQQGPPAPWSELRVALGALLAGSILSFALVNLGPLAIKVLATEEESAAAGQFLVALVVARVPLFLFQAVQAALLPHLSRLATVGDLAGFRRGLARLIALLTAVGAVGAIAAAAAGPTVVRLLFGPEYAIGVRTMMFLAAASGIYMVATAIAQANIALSGHGRAAWAWAAGVTAFLASVAATSDDLFLRVELASVVGCAAALAAQAWAVFQLLREQRPIDRGHLLEAIVEHPMAP